MKIGTSHFVTLAAAVRYYKAYGLVAYDVKLKIAREEIHIGAPQLKDGERLSIIQSEQRYQIEVQS